MQRRSYLVFESSSWPGTFVADSFWVPRALSAGFCAACASNLLVLGLLMLLNPSEEHSRISGDWGRHCRWKWQALAEVAPASKFPSVASSRRLARPLHCKSDLIRIEHLMQIACLQHWFLEKCKIRKLESFKTMMLLTWNDQWCGPKLLLMRPWRDKLGLARVDLSALRVASSQKGLRTRWRVRHYWCNLRL